MAGVATPITLTDEERSVLKSLVRKTTTEQRIVQRARMVLEAAAGKTTKEIASRMQVRRATVSRWRTRFAHARLAGLEDAPRRGKPVVYGAETERRILAKLDEPPPDGHSTWTGGLLAQVLEDVPAAQVWKVLRQHGIHLQRRRSWCLSTDVPGPAGERHGVERGRETLDSGPGARPGVAPSSQRQGPARSHA